MIPDGGGSQPPFARRPFTATSQIRWPGEHRLAATVSVLLSRWSLTPSDQSVRDERLRVGFGSYSPDYWSSSTWEYGLRVGVFRVLDVLAELGIGATFAIDADVCLGFPRIVKAVLDGGHEIAAHGVSGTEMHSSRMSSDGEAALISSARSVLGLAAGSEPRGWYSPGRGNAPRTAGLVAENGFQYVCDWPNDDLPYLLNTNPAIVSLPRSADFEDIEALHVQRQTPSGFVERIRLALERLQTETQESYLNLSIHPWLSGQPHHIKYMKETFRLLRSSGAVWVATADEVARSARESLN